MDIKLYTDVGGREVNEDSADFYSDSDSGAFCVVCDGLGGHGKGEVASSLVVNTMIDKFKQLTPSSDNVFDLSITHAQELLLQAQRDLDAEDEMKTTLVALNISDGKAQWAHVGDSRLYLFRNKKLSTRTLDHSVCQVLVASGEIKEKHIRHHEDRNRLLRVMGTEWNSPKYEVSEPVDIMPGDAFLLCSDGFWEFITEKEMLKCLKKSSSAEQWLSLMSDIVQKNGRGKNMDNNTAICVIV